MVVINPCDICELNKAEFQHWLSNCCIDAMRKDKLGLTYSDVIIGLTEHLKILIQEEYEQRT
jgi:hypothetical protein